MSNVQIQRGGNAVAVAPVFDPETAAQVAAAILASSIKSIPLPPFGVGLIHPGYALILSTTTAFGRASSDSGSVDPNVVGLFDGNGRIQQSGPLELATAQWDVTAGTTDGLTPNTVYYLSSAGTLTAVAPSATGTFITPVGIALSPTVLDIRISAANGPHA